MRKLVVMMAVGALAGLLLLPPDASAAEPKFGLKIGLNLANLTGSDVASYEDFFGPVESKIAFAGGGFVVFELSKGMAIQAEALYTQKGADFDMPVDSTVVTVHWITDYIEIPVLFRYTIETTGNIKPMLFAGPAVAFKLTSKVKATSGGASEEMDIPGFKSTDFGLVFGGGIGIGKISVDIRYTMGLTKLIEIEGEPGNLKNSVFSLMVGYSFK